ncbi:MULTISPECIES: hypothetical protein [unclassified Bradyrhizobium]|uniref:hypothetical protein n=1 Tax=unclassified Bradyrhizobium TaxID=2631580 RepID=UPI003390BB25
MTRLPRHSVELGTSFQRVDLGDHTPAAQPTISQADGIEIEAAQVDDGKRHAPSFRDRPSQDLPVGATIEPAVELDSVDPVSRVNFNMTRGQVGETAPCSELARLNGPNLAGNLLSFVTPRLRHWDVLRADKHGLLLQTLAVALSAAPEDSVSPEGIGVLQQELRRLVLLRQNQNGLIKG